MGLLEALRQQGIETLQNVDGAALCSFKVGGKVDFLLQPKTAKELCAAVAACGQWGVRYVVIGRGSNLLFSDDGYRGAVIRLAAPFSKLEMCPQQGVGVFTAEAGADLSAACNFAAQNGLSGLQFAFGIPGTVGGAVFMNAGAYGGEMSQVVQSGTVLCKNGTVERRTAKDFGFAYRHSSLQQNGEVVLWVDFALQKGNAQQIKEEMRELSARRAEKQPLSQPSAGSTFKRPQNGYASALIDECGLKGFAVGGAAVSTKHAGFVVNTGGATATDITQLCREVQKIVEQKKGVRLELEVQPLPAE